MGDSVMKRVGVRFKIPNEYGKFLSDILEVIPNNQFIWLVDSDEIYKIKNNEFTAESLFGDEERVINGDKLVDIASNNAYYLIFLTLRAFIKHGNVERVSKYEQFLSSDCQMILAIYDSSYVMFWCKNDQLVLDMYNNALLKEYEDIKYISEDDLLQGKYYIE